MNIRNLENMSKTILAIGLFVLMLATLPASAHVSSGLLPEGCGSCHVGHGMDKQPMLESAEEDFCFKCHGSDEDRSAMISDGRLSPAARLDNLESVFKKPYRHPVEEGFGHSPTEKLPAFKGSSVSHAECTDCHNPHQRIQMSENQVYEVSGYNIAGQQVEKSLHEYEICLKCHAENVGFDKSPRNLMREFAVSDKSQHPVTKASTGKALPSLSTSVPRGTMMKCSSCHTNDDPDGPSGPHGSNHQYLLSGNYNTDVYSDETPYAYEFCYSCHDRSSILSDESFPFHSEHILGDPLENRRGTSCFSCHASHGSRDNANLIEFNPKAVTSDTGTGILTYRSNGDGTGECYLTCHGHAHGPERY